MDKIVSKLAGVGVPVLVLLVAMGATGYAGAAALTTALAALGPGGMIGGVAVLLVAGVASQGISEFGFDKIFSAVVKELIKRGESEGSLRRKINGYPVSKALKLKLHKLLDDYFHKN